MFYDEHLSKNARLWAGILNPIVLAAISFLFCLSFSFSEAVECLNCATLINGQPNPKCKSLGAITYDILTPCSGYCFHRSVAGQGELIVRGCTTDLKGLPAILPSYYPDCYDWEGATFCICATIYCNNGPLELSSGYALDYEERLQTSTVEPELTTALPAPTAPATAAAATTAAAAIGTTIATTTATTTTIVGPTGTTTRKRIPPPVLANNFTTQCIECRNFDNGTFNDASNSKCPKDGSVPLGFFSSSNCTGPCFTSSDTRDKRFVIRGCKGREDLSSVVPGKDCYDSEGYTICFCYEPNCNNGPLGISSGDALADYLEEFDKVPNSGPLQCYQCLNYNLDGTYVPQCPKDDRVSSQTVFRGNCSGACFIKTMGDNSAKVARGCTTTQYGMPAPLPPSGCYSWNKETWCICNTTNCNGGPIGVSNGVELDEHLNNLPYDFEEPDNQKKCYECLSYANGQFYPQCPKDRRVRNAYLGNCNGTCFTRTYDADDRVIARGCSDTQYGLPNPLPPDGCYKWYTEVWCVCSGTRCNGAALGTALNLEFDAHIKERKGNDQTIIRGDFFLVLPSLTIAYIVKRTTDI